MKVTRCCVIISLLMLTTCLKADLDIFDICTESADQLEPDIDGDWIAWHDVRNGVRNYDIYGYTLAEPNAIPICTASGNQKSPAVAGHIAVWQDERNGQRDIYAFNLSTRMPTNLPNMPLNDGLSQFYPDISNDVIVYRHEQDGYKLFTYDIPSQMPVQMVAASSSQLNFTIDGSIVVWMEQVGSVYQIFMKNLSHTEPAFRISETVYSQWYPAVSGSTIVWAEDRGTASGCDLYGFDVNNPIAGEFSIYTGSGDQTRPAISGKLVVWQDKPDGQTDYDIRALDLSTGDLFDIAVDTPIDYDDQNPAISGRTVVWQRMNADWDIVGAEIPFSASTVINITSPGNDDMYLAKSQMQIAWQLVDGPSPDFVNIEFSPDNGDTWPVTVATGVPFTSNYLWDSVQDVNSVQCRISIRAVGGGSASDTSDSFTVFSVQ